MKPVLLNANEVGGMWLANHAARVGVRVALRADRRLAERADCSARSCSEKCRSRIRNHVLLGPQRTAVRVLVPVAITT